MWFIYFIPNFIYKIHTFPFLSFIIFLLSSTLTKSTDNEVMRDFCQNQSASISLFAIAPSVDFSGRAAALFSSFKNSS